MYAQYLQACFADDPHFYYPITPANPNGDISKYAAGSISGGTAPTVMAPERAMRRADPMFLFNSNRMISTATNAAFYNASFTLEAIYLPTVTAPFGDIATCAPLTGGLHCSIIDFIAGPFLRFSIGNTAGGHFFDCSVSTSTLGIIPGKRLHLVGSTDGARADFWINGVLVASDSTTSGTRMTTASGLCVGAFNNSFNNYLIAGGVSHVAGYHKYDTSLAARHYAALRSRARRSIRRAA